MKNRGPSRQKKADIVSIIKVKIMVHEYSNYPGVCYTVSVGEKLPANYLHVRQVIANQAGRYQVPSLIEALTQDPVLTSISQKQGKEKCK